MTPPARCGFLSASTENMSTGMRGSPLLALLVSVFVTFFRGARGQEGYSLNPPYFNLAEGSRISATATCGQDEAGTPRNDLYCKLVGGPTFEVPIQNIQGQFCDYCNSRDPNKAHPVTNAIDGTERWWQSPPLSRGMGYNEVTVTLDLGQLFHVAYVLIKFANSPRPDLWVLERSWTMGRTYSPWQYFAHSKHECIERFAKQPNGRILRDDDQLCTTEYSRIVPLENGEIVVSLVNGRPGSRNFTYSPVLQDFTKATNIRLHFLRTSTLLGHLISKAQRDPTVTRRYYYSIKDISVGGRCVCHGHAQVCGGRNQDNANRLQCECQHNTCGESCDRCCPGFHQKPWRAATIDNPNECQPCHCFSHAFDCYYDPEVEKRGASLDTFGRYDGGGVCISCQHNTDGVNCERCREGFYRPYGVPPESPAGCIACRCDTRVTAGCEMGSGRCICKPQYAGENCDRCADGYYGFPHCIRYPIYQTTTQSPAGPIVECMCDYRGTVREVCDALGRCLCRQGVYGERCDRCLPGHHSFPECHACLCDGAGVAHSSCSPSGQCFCHSNYEGQRCDKCAPGHYGYPDCSVCQCTPEGSHGTECNPLSGQCLCLPGVVGQRCDRCAASGLRFPQCSEPVICPPGYFGSPNCQQCVCNYRGTMREVCDASGRCLCRQGVHGEQCDRCLPGHHSFPECREPVVCPLGYFGSPNCQQCMCDYRGTVREVCDALGRCLCRQGVHGERCDRCLPGHHSFPECHEPVVCPPGYFGSPNCQQCVCDYRGTVREVCDASGRCLCRQGVHGEQCDRCLPGHHSFPECRACLCDGAGVAHSSCSPSGQCFCRSNYEGQQCDKCAPGHYGYPDCAVCQCMPEGSHGTECNPLSGQCLCLPGVVGQRCDHCAASGLRFPQCSVPISLCSPAGSEGIDPQTGSCRCRPNVVGATCDTCKSLYWNLATNNPQGCTECRCDVRGTLSGVGECDQKSGQCYCKLNACGRACDSCEEGFFLLQKRNYFGCQGCQCDVGGAVGVGCDDTSGQCRCRKNVVGRKCNEPAPNYYFPTLHQLKFEAEDGTTPNARPVRFGYDPREFPEFSWRGYAVLSPAQNEIRVPVHVDPQDGKQHLFRVVLRFTNPSSSTVTGSIMATNNKGTSGSNQSKEVVFPKSPTPAFLTVPGEGFAEPFALTPGKWMVHIQAQGILLDYLVLLPRDYYEAPLLQKTITQPCTYLPTATRDTNCLLYKNVAMDGFSSALGSKGKLSNRSGRKRRQARVQRPTPNHPEMALLSGKQSQLQLSLRVPHPGPYALVLEYVSEVDMVQNVNLVISGQSARANIYSCAFSFMCRSVAVDSGHRVAFLQLTHTTVLLLQTSTDSFLLYKVYAVPAEDFSMEYVEPKVLCASIHGPFNEVSQHCVQMQFRKPPDAWILEAARDGQRSSVPDVAPDGVETIELRRRRQSRAVHAREPQCDGVLLKYPQTQISFTPRVPLPGRYVVVLHYRQPEHISFPVEVKVDAGRDWTGSVNASFCPAVSGCRDVVVADGRIALDLKPESWRLPTISVTIPPGKTLELLYIMLVPDSSYTPDLLKEKPLDKSADFMQQCSGDALHIHPRNSSQFCTDSARSLVAAYNDGALPCNCDTSGSTATSCDPVGGQCPCRQHVIGRQCTKCATGYYSFPYCKPCECGPRHLCDEVTGRCICPPQTILPACDVCQNQMFSYHPLLGCEDCECSPTGIRVKAGPNCDRVTGQCTCKPRIGGRRCDRCAAGYYRFPDCLPCNCKRGGVTPDVCDPDTGKCLCKRNVAGKRCNTCREGSFYFDPSDPKGCTKCLLLRVTDRCQSSSNAGGRCFVKMHGWCLESPDLQEIPTALNTVSNTAVADVQELPPTVQELHWVAPPSYLGNKVSSYGGFLTYQSKSFGIPSEGMTLMDRRPDIILNGHNMTLIHMSPQLPSPDRLYQGRVQLVEGNWRHAGTNRPVSREELMIVLASLTDLRIRALYFTKTQRLSLGEVGMEMTTEEGSGVPGNIVEDCTCPPQYAGDSCEKCAPGFYRDVNLPNLGVCVPCDCNGLADECDERTGRCLNCRYDTAGDHCERCKKGFYGNPAQRTCRVCPCPLSTPNNSFAVGCREFAGELQCTCRTGYTGHKCERCAPGYYGDPLIIGGRCHPCNCIGNSNTCDARTGVCKNTLEPKDTNTDDFCRECDSCVQTLLHDLEKLDDELRNIKAELENMTANASSQEDLQKLVKAVSDTKILVNKFNSSITKQKSKVDELEQDMITLNKDVDSVEEKADKMADDASKSVADVEKTHNRAKQLDDEVKNMLKKIQDLLDRLRDWTAGVTVVSEDLAKMLEEAERMVKEMQQKNFTPQKTAAEEEREAAKKLLDYIKNDVSKQSDQNEAAAEKLRDLLDNYNTKLKDLDRALKEAVDKVKKANTQNGLSAQTLDDLLRRIDELKRERKMVEDQMAMAEDELQKVEDLINGLSDSKTDYERQAAQLDGARNDLTKKVNEVTKAAAQEGIVKDAEEHAKNLAKLAKDLEGAVKNATGRPEVINAKDAIDAYKNITDAINAAEAAANEAKQAADNALKNVKDQNLTKRAKDLKNRSNDALNGAKAAEKDLEDIKDDLNDVTDRLKNAANKKNLLENDLNGIQDRMKDINRDDISDMINEAKMKAALANETANDTTDKLNDIKKQIEAIKVPAVHSNLSSVMDEVDESVKKLLKTIPSLTDKISEVENLTSEFSPLSNITDNIKKIKDLIEQARNTANRITVPMMFKGDGYVEMRPPKDLDDLKAYTTMSLSLQRPESRGDGRRRRRQTTDKGNMFVLYLGNKDSSKNYIGMALRNNVLYTVYKLNGQVYQLETGQISESAPEPAMFDRVDLRRTYQDFEVSLTKEITSGAPAAPLTKTSQGVETKNLLNLEPDDMVFYVGGYPSNFTPPPSLNYPKYEGCIEFVSFNDRIISLYNFQKAEKVNLVTPCKRYLPKQPSEYYEGTGYAEVPLDNGFFSLNMAINSLSSNGLLLYIGNEMTYYIVTIEKGEIFLHSNLEYKSTPQNVKSFPTKESAEFAMRFRAAGQDKGSFIVTMSNKLVLQTTVEYRPDDMKRLYIGGAPRSLREKFNITNQPFKGCMNSVKLNTNPVNPIEKFGISNGCPEYSLISRKAEFSLGSSLSDDLKGFSLADNVVVSLGFKSTENQGLLLQNKQAADGINLALENGHVVLTFSDKTWKSNNQYSDGKWHYLTVNRKSGRVQFLIDDKDEGQEQSGGTAVPDTGGSVFLGRNNFKGCISNLYTRRPQNLFKIEDLSAFVTSGNVLVDVCPADAPAQQMLDRSTKKDVTMGAVNETLSACALPGVIPHAYRMGGSVSRLSYNLPPQAGHPRLHFSLDVRTRSLEGLLFFAATKRGRSHFALYMSKGRIRLSVGKELEIFNREKYNDGKWHSVIFSLEKKKFRLVVDGIRAQDGQLTNAELASMELMSPVYMGSTPESLHKELKWKSLPKQSVSGCVRSLRIYGAPMSHPTTNQGAGPCFDGQTQKGAYFSGNGAHIVLSNTFVDDSGFELLFSIRPRSPTGLLLHVGDSRKTQYEPTMDHYLSVYMLRGKVVAQVNNRNEEFKVSVRPNASLCDGMFHKISVIKRKNVLQLHVDTVGTYKIGPPTFTSTLTKDPLYVGGIPDKFHVQQMLPVTSSFTGCIKDMGINGKSVFFERLPGVFGPINLRECPAG
ncbi:LOW QUALITY PROTEIN: laminin subunit alpha-3-like [Thalassophryne amazonica]|uniref:LOW QUALITY PROTEIN: laminin subunit alpha-3-like n=1 Tax=Thalassophryne amazonica TaxID=390379 RepID=UPI001471EAB0|nr:LOW QUALITY PROTEIN: laminin subunit alpha-3-like [Thalassophryne amazonica]